MYRKLTDKEKNKYKILLDRAEVAFGIDREDGFLVNNDGKESILFVYDLLFMLFSLENEEIKITSFIIDSDYKVVSMSKNDRQYITGDNSLYLIGENGIHNSLAWINDGNNSIIEYMQYDSKKDLRIYLRYDYFGSLGSQIYQYHMKDPYYICIENKASKRDRGLKFLGSKKAYYKLDFSQKNKLRYLLAQAKEDTGAIKVNNNSGFGENGDFFRYYRTLLQVGEYVTITGFPFSKQYKMQDLEAILKDLGFDTLKKYELVNMYNEKDKMKEEFQLIADEFRKSNVSIYKKSIIMQNNG